GLPSNQPILLAFSSPMNTLSVRTHTTISMRVGTTGDTYIPVTGLTFNFTTSSRTVAILPTGNFWQSNTAYRVDVTAGVEDRFGFTTSEALSYVFVTGLASGGSSAGAPGLKASDADVAATVISPLDPNGTVRVDLSAAALAQNGLSVV